MSRRTPLHPVHLAAGARMVDFGGFDMPLHYGSQIDEHHAVRRDAGVFDVSHMRAVDVEGRGARDFLRFALANNVDKLKVPGKALYSCLLREDGGVRDDLIAYLIREDLFRMVVNASTADADIAWLAELNGARGGALALRARDDLAMLAVQGPNARAKTWFAMPGCEVATAALKPFTGVEATTDIGDMFIARTGYTGEDGFEILLPAARVADLWNSLVASGVKPCGLGARDTLRLEAGMNLYGQDMDETVTPLESGLAWTVDLASARDFVGKAALAAQKPARQLVGLVLEGAGGVLRAHQQVTAGSGPGEITSGTFGPTIEKSIALARLPIEVAPGELVEVAVRDKRLPARVVKPPFVRNGTVLV